MILILQALRINGHKHRVKRDSMIKYVGWSFEDEPAYERAKEQIKEIECCQIDFIYPEK